MEYRRDSSRISDEDSLWANINSNLAKLEKVEDEGLELSKIINQLHEQIHQTGSVTPEVGDKLRNMYKKALEQTGREEEMANIINKDIDKLLALQSQISKQSLKVTMPINDDSTYKKSKKRDHETTGLSSGVNKQMKKSKVGVPKNTGNIIKNGSFVAAKQPKSKDPEENWILATVVDYRADTKHYEIEDIDKDEASNRPGERFSVPSKNVIEIPNQGEMRIPEFPQSHTVFALYPNTTCFYKAVVVTPPSKLVHRTRYLLAFEDDEDAQRLVEVQHVLEVPDDIK